MTMLVINCGPGVECQFMLKSRGDHAHQILSRSMYVPRVMVIFVHLGLL
jgi:hypothetical protein